MIRPMLTLLAFLAAAPLAQAGALDYGVVVEKTKDKLVIVTRKGERMEFVPTQMFLEKKIEPTAVNNLSYQDVRVGDEVNVEHHRNPALKINLIEGLRLLSRAVDN